MKITSFVLALFALSLTASASPVRRYADVANLARTPLRRWVTNYLKHDTKSGSEAQSDFDKRHEGHDEDDDTKSSTVQAAAAAVTSNIRVATSTTLASIDLNAEPTRKGTEDGVVPNVGVGGTNTGLLPLLTKTNALAANAVPASSTVTISSAQNAAAVTITVTKTESQPPAVTVTTTLSASAASTPSNISSARSIQPIAAKVSGSDIGSDVTTTVRVQTTRVATVTVSASEAIGDVSASLASIRSQSTFPAPSSRPAVTVIFVTASPTFSGAIAGYTTIVPAINSGSIDANIAAASSGVNDDVTTTRVISLTKVATVVVPPTNVGSARVNPASASSTESRKPCPYQTQGA